jgi:hypothetical protein
LRPRCISASERSTTRSSARGTSSASRSPPDAAPTVPGHRIAPRPAATRSHNAIEALVVRVGLGERPCRYRGSGCAPHPLHRLFRIRLGSVQPVGPSGVRAAESAPIVYAATQRGRRDAAGLAVHTLPPARAHARNQTNEVFAALLRSPRRSGSRQHSRAGQGTGGRRVLSAAIFRTRSTALARGRQQPAPVPSVT